MCQILQNIPMVIKQQSNRNITSSRIELVMINIPVTFVCVCQKYIKGMFTEVSFVLKKKFLNNSNDINNRTGN